MGKKKKSGVNELAKVLTSRMKEESKSPLAIDFGEIATNLSLITNTFPVPIPKEDYSLLQPLKREGEMAIDTEYLVEAGDRVLVAWIGAEAVILGTI